MVEPRSEKAKMARKFAEKQEDETTKSEATNAAKTFAVLKNKKTFGSSQMATPLFSQRM